MNTLPSTSSAPFNYSAVPFQRQFVSAQRRYDNMRVRENEMQNRLCRECGRIVHGDDLSFQHHIVSHEAAFICYQIYHFEKGTTLPKNYFGHSQAKFTKDKSVTSPKKLARDLVRKQMKQPVPKKRKSTETSQSSQPKRSRRESNVSKKSDSRFINDGMVKKELNLSEDESDVSNLTESDPEDVILPVDDDDVKLHPQQDPEDADYVPLQSTSSRGRARKPKNVD